MEKEGPLIMTDELISLYKNNKGKVSDKWFLYLKEYNRLFTPLMNEPVNMLEIGIQNGGSLEVWSKFFKNAIHLVGCDIDCRCKNLKYEDPRVKIIIGDANTDICKDSILNVVSSFDVVIDDSSHFPGDIIKSFVRYFESLNYGGLYIVEDLHSSYWRDYNGGLYHPYSSIAFFKTLVDILNFEFWGIKISRRDFILRFEEFFNIKFNEKCLSEIHSIEFINSLCIIKKGEPHDNTLGQEVVTGSIDIVDKNAILRNGKFMEVPNQERNIWTNPIFPMEDKLLRLINGYNSKVNKNSLSCQLFYDKENGFNEVNSIRLLIDINNNVQEFVFDLSKIGYIKTLRFDPLNDAVVLCINKITLIKTNGDIIDLTRKIKSNACIITYPYYFFNTKDPQIYFEWIKDRNDFSDIQNIILNIQYIYKGEDALNACINKMIEKLK